MGENNISDSNVVDKKTTTITDAGKKWNVQLTYLNESISKSIGGTESKVMDPWNEQYNAMGSEKILPPPFNQSVMMLAQTRDISPPLSRLIEAMVTNITKFGYEFKPHEWVENPESSEVQKEKDSISKLFQYPNSDIQSFIELRSAIEQDYEEVGYAGMEIVENSKNEIAELYYLPAPTFRLTIRDTIFTPFQQNILAGKGDIEIIDRKKRFRRIVQIDEAEQKVFFREWGDPRDVDYQTGNIRGDKAGIESANEVIMFKQQRSWTPYGIPRYYSSLLDIVGAAKAAYVNYLFFDNKTIPPIIITISGGTVPEKVMKQLQQLYRSEIKGMDNFHNALIIEAEPQALGEVEGEKFANTKIDIKPLTQFIQSDANFLGYQNHIMNNLEAAFRLPGIYSGREGSYNRATAFVAARLAEQQVFAPRRESFDWIINNTILSRMKVKYWGFHSKGANTSDIIETIKGISTIKEAMFVGDLIELSRTAQGRPIDNIPPELYEITLAEHNRGGIPNVNDLNVEADEFEKVVNKAIGLGERLEKKYLEGM